MSHGSKKNLNARLHNENLVGTNDSSRRFLGSYLDCGATDDGATKEQKAHNNNWE